MNARNLPKFALSLENIVISAWLYRKKNDGKKEEKLEPQIKFSCYIW